MALPERECARDGCSVMFAPQRASARYHSGGCRAQAALDRKEAARVAAQAGGPAEPVTPAPNPVEAAYLELGSALVTSTRGALERAEVLDTPAGHAVMMLAIRLEHGYAESAPALAALNREFRSALEAALARDTKHRDQVGDARMLAQQTRFRVAGQRAS